MLLKAFEQLKKEARLGEVKFIDDKDERIVRIQFNIVDDNERNDIPNFYIQNQNNFYFLLNEYMKLALKFYNLEQNYNNIKKVLTFLFVNITNNEMNNLEEYILKYINFLSSKKLSNQTEEKNVSLGILKYEVLRQSMMQETPYCFKANFQNGNSKYALPRISFGISDNVCYIYAIQNKHSKINFDSKYNLEVKDKLRTINSGISKYRNVTPSFVVVLSLFVSFLKENGISKIKVVTPLPIRQKNREMSTQAKIKFYSMNGNISKDQVEVFKKEIIEKKFKR